MFLDTPKDLGHQRGKLPSGAGDSQTCTKKTCGECRSYMVQSPVEWEVSVQVFSGKDIFIDFMEIFQLEFRFMINI